MMFPFILAPGFVMAQCTPDTVLIKSSKVDFINNSSGAIERSEKEPLSFALADSFIKISPDAYVEDALTGDVVDAKCEWSTPFEKGKSTFRTALKDERGEETPQ